MVQFSTFKFHFSNFQFLTFKFSTFQFFNFSIYQCLYRVTQTEVTDVYLPHGRVRFRTRGLAARDNNAALPLQDNAIVGNRSLADYLANVWQLQWGVECWRIKSAMDLIMTCMYAARSLVSETMFIFFSDMTCVISNRGTWGNLNLEKNEKE